MIHASGAHFSRQGRQANPSQRHAGNLQGGSWRGGAGGSRALSCRQRCVPARPAHTLAELGGAASSPTTARHSESDVARQLELSICEAPPTGLPSEQVVTGAHARADWGCAAHPLHLYFRFSSWVAIAKSWRPASVRTCRPAAAGPDSRARECGLAAAAGRTAHPLFTASCLQR